MKKADKLTIENVAEMALGVLVEIASSHHLDPGVRVRAAELVLECSARSRSKPKTKLNSILSELDKVRSSKFLKKYAKTK
jgi:hypothetical protein